MEKKPEKPRETSWGGRRTGAGRKVANPEGPVESVGVSIPAALMAELDAVATERGWTRSQAVTEAIRRLVKSVKRRRA